jgi:hypothetical protein
VAIVLTAAFDAQATDDVTAVTLEVFEALPSDEHRHPGDGQDAQHHDDPDPERLLEEPLCY